MTPNETEKIKLMQLFRQGKIDNLPDVDSDEYKAQKIKSMLDKEKSMEENYQMDGEVYSRIDGLVSQSLLKSFLNTFKAINTDLVEGGDEFDIDDIVDYLTIQLDKESKNIDGFMGEEVNEGKSREEVESIISKYLDADDTKDYLNMHYNDVKDMSTSDILADLDDTAASAPLTSYKKNLQEVDGGVEFFKRIAFKK